ncbi:MAG: CpXC domain-containing protein [Oscillospiraceae bacterium]|nr:CpXC domain-containing protein [Oscillospiraceae bacterium]
MSRRFTETITCPKCNNTQGFDVWYSLNADIDPDAKEQLLNGTLFGYRCEKCGYESNVDYGMLYHDMTNMAMVYYVHESEIEETKKGFIDTNDMMGIEMPEYKKRIVTNRNALREKAVIFDNGLDDRPIEIIKLLYDVKAMQDNPDAKISAVYFIVKDGEYVLEFLGDTPMVATIPSGLYERIANDYAERIELFSKNECVIDRAWARKVIRKSKSE